MSRNWYATWLLSSYGKKSVHFQCHKESYYLKKFIKCTHPATKHSNTQKNQQSRDPKKRYPKKNPKPYTTPKIQILKISIHPDGNTGFLVGDFMYINYPKTISFTIDPYHGNLNKHPLRRAQNKPNMRPSPGRGPLAPQTSAWDRSSLAWLSWAPVRLLFRVYALTTRTSQARFMVRSRREG